MTVNIDCRTRRDESRTRPSVRYKINSKEHRFKRHVSCSATFVSAAWLHLLLELYCRGCIFRIGDMIVMSSTPWAQSLSNGELHWAHVTGVRCIVRAGRLSPGAFPSCTSGLILIWILLAGSRTRETASDSFGLCPDGDNMAYDMCANDYGRNLPVLGLAREWALQPKFEAVISGMPL